MSYRTITSRATSALTVSECDAMPTVQCDVNETYTKEHRNKLVSKNNNLINATRRKHEYNVNNKVSFKVLN